MNDRIARTQSLLAGAGEVVLAGEPDFRLGRLEVQPSLLQVRHAASSATLEPRVMQVLVALARSRDQVIGRAELVDRCWAGRVVGDNAINRVISRIRHLAATLGEGSFEIETVPRVGYRLNLAGEPVRPAEAEAEAEAEAGAEAEATAPPRRRWALAAAAVAAAGLAGAGWWSRTRPPALVAAGDGNTLAVLPFKPLGDAAGDGLLELGMADSLIARLSSVPGLVVRSTGSSLRFTGRAQDPLQAARELGVAWIVDGSLQRSGEQLRATARLLRAADGAAAWSGSFDEKFTSVFDVQDQISQRVMRALAPVLHTELAALPPRRGELGGTRNADAYQLYLAAMWRAQGQRPEDIARALQLLEQATALDPGYALAWAGLAWTHRRGLWIDAPPAQVFAAAEAASARALALAPALAEARAELGFSSYWYRYDWAGAEREFRAAVEARPNAAVAHFGLAQLLLTQDRIDEGMLHMQRTRELDPLSPVFNTIEASFLIELGRLAEAEARLQRALDIAPGLWLAHLGLGLLHRAQGRHPE